MRFPELPGYRYEEFLGEDSFGWRFLAMHEHGERRAVRIFKAQGTNDRVLQPFFRALAADARSLPGIDPVYEYRLQDAIQSSVCSTPFHGWRSGVGEPWHTGTLDEVMGMLSPMQCVQMVQTLAHSLAELHKVNLFHGGLRPSAIWMVSGSNGRQSVRIGEFGSMFAKGLQFLEAGDFLFYAAPEQLSTGDFNEGRGRLWDVYSFGVLAYRLLTGRLPRLQQLSQRCKENPEWLRSTAAMIFGEPAEVAEYFCRQIESKPEIQWPKCIAESYRETLLPVINRCLAITAQERPQSMVQVAEEIHQILPYETTSLSPMSAPASEKAVGESTVPSATIQQEEKSKNTSKLVDEKSLVEVSRISRGQDRGLRHVWNDWLQRYQDDVVFRMRLALAGSLVVTLVATYFAFFNFLQTRREKTLVEDDLRESEKKRQVMVQRQAAAYQKLQDEESKKKQLVSELNESEDSKNQLLGQAKLARQLLRETQDNGDRFFKIVLENRDSDVPDFRKARMAALETGQHHYERLIEIYGDASDFIVSTANAYFYLGNIYREMGEFGKSLAAFAESERRYSALLEDQRSAKVEYVENIARAKRALGDLALRNHQLRSALDYYTESSHFWTEARTKGSELKEALTLCIHENSLSIAEVQFEQGNVEAALDAAMSVGVRLTDMQKADPKNHRVVGDLAHSFALAGRVLEAKGESALAKDAFQQASDLYAEAVKLDAAVDQYQLGLGNSLARVGVLAKDTAKLEGAAEVLGRVVAANPYESTYLKTLADIYGTLAEQQRDGGNMKNAISLEQRAIAILGPIVNENRSVAADVRYSYAQRLTHLAELLGDSGKFDDSRGPLKEAIALLEDITKQENAPIDYRRSLARTRGLAGFACIRSGDKGEAKKHLEIAKSEWQSYFAANPQDSDANQAIQWTSEQLAKLP